jgi:hypothetical protein
VQFYARFRDEVISEPQTIATHVERAREQVPDSFRELFDGALGELHDDSSRTPETRRPRSGSSRSTTWAREHARPDHFVRG